MLLRQALSRARPALARRVRRITHREEGRKLPREMVAAMTSDGDASSYFESMRSRVAASGATRAASSSANDDYVALADEALDTILEKADELSDDRDDVEVELASGVLTLKTPEGTWVLNKQVPNRQLWLSSPVSGPCRYEYVEGTWTHTRDGSSLAELLERELGLIM
jgi:frataxin